MAEDNHIYWMRKALQLAQQASDMDEVPVGAVLVLDDEVVGEGCNQPISTNDPTAHAEMVAIREAAKRVDNYRLPGSTLYVTLEPCSMCAGAIVHSRISKVVFGAKEPKSGVLCSQHQFFQMGFLNHKPELLGGILEKECSAILTDFFEKKRELKRQLKNE